MEFRIKWVDQHRPDETVKYDGMTVENGHVSFGRIGEGVVRIINLKDVKEIRRVDDTQS